MLQDHNDRVTVNRKRTPRKIQVGGMVIGSFLTLLGLAIYVDLFTNLTHITR